MRRIGPALGSFEAVDLADDVDLGDRFEGPPLARRWDRCGAGPVDLADDVDLGDRLEGPPLARIGRRGGLSQQIVTTKILRRRVFALAGRITRSACRLTLHLPQRWPWEEQFSRALARLRAIPLPA